MRRSPATSGPRARRPLPTMLPPVEGAALAGGPGGIVLHLRVGGDTVRVPLSPDALREIAALATDALAAGRRRAGMH